MSNTTSNTTGNTTSAARAKATLLDQADPLADSRRWFELPEEVIYLDGNSLGPLPGNVLETMRATIMDEWGHDLIQSWNKNDWINLPETVGEKIAGIIGAGPGQVVATDSTSVNLFKLIVAALNANPGRTEILSQVDNFPTDLYMAEGVATMLGADRATLKSVTHDELHSSLSNQTAVLMLTHVNFRDGRVHDMAQLTQLAHENGALVLWDLSHSTGVFPLGLDELNVDFATGCGYKYLNGGPGAPAYVYVNKRHLHRANQPLTGWMGHAQPFAFSPGYQPAPGIGQYLTGTPGVLSMRALSAALDLYEGLDLQAVRQKSMALTDYFVELISEIDALEIVSPLEANSRGSQVSLRHPAAYAMMQALINDGVIGDYREPDLMRFGFAPMYTSFTDVFQAAYTLQKIIDSGSFMADRFQARKPVT